MGFVYDAMVLCKAMILVGALLLVTTVQMRMKQVNDLMSHQDGTLAPAGLRTVAAAFKPGAVGHSSTAAGKDALAMKSIQQGKEKGGKGKKGEGKPGAQLAVEDEQAAA